MRGKDELLAIVLARLEEATNARDMSLVLTPEVLGEARELRELLSDDASELKARYVLGWLHWYRYQAPGGQDRSDNDTAIAMFAPCFLAGGAEVPAPLRPAIAARVAPVLGSLTERALRSDDLGLITGTIDVWRRVMDASPDDQKWAILSNIGAVLHAKSKLTGGISDLDAAIESARAALAAIPEAHPDRPGVMSNLGAMLTSRFEITEAPADLDAAIETGRMAVTDVSDDHSGRPGMLSNLAGHLRHRFELSGNAVDLDQAIGIAREAVDSGSPDHRDRPGILANLGSMLRTKFLQTGLIDDLEAAIEATRRAAATVQPGHPEGDRIRRSLVGRLYDKFEQTGAAADLDAAIEAARQAIEGRASADATMQANLSTMLSTRFERTQEQADLDDAIEVSTALINGEAVGDPLQAIWMSDLGVLLHTRFKLTRASVDLDSGIQALQSAVTTARETQREELASIVLNLTAMLHARYEITGNLADLEEAIQTVQALAAAASPAEPKYAELLSVLAADLGRRFGRTGNYEDLDAGVEKSQAALKVIPEGDPDRVHVLSNLGELLRSRFWYTGLLSDLEAAIEADRAAVQATPDDDPQWAHLVANLGAALRSRFDQTGSLEDLDAAIEMARSAVDRTAGSDADLARYLSNLTVALTARFERMGVLEDLDAAIDAANAAVQETGDDHPSRAWRLANLAMALDARFERTGKTPDLDAAIEASRASISATPDGHPERARYLSNLGVSLYSRFQRTESAKDLDAAIEAARAAVAATPEDQAKRPTRLSNLGMMLRTRYRHTSVAAGLEAAATSRRKTRAPAAPEGHHGQAAHLSDPGADLAVESGRTNALEDLEEALRAAQAAVDNTPADYPARATYLFNLGLSLQVRYGRTGDTDDREAAVSALTTAAGLFSAAPTLRIRAARAAARLSVEAEPARAAGLLADAVRLLAEVAPRRLARGDQQHAISEFGGLASDAAALALQAEPAAPQQAGQALRLLEAGRMVLMSQVLDTRDDLTDLRERHPDLAEQFLQLRDQLDRADPVDIERTDAVLPDATLGGAAEDRHRRAAKLMETLAKIRDQVGFSSFGLPPGDEELLAEAESGPVVTFNVSRYGSAALLLTMDGISSLQLPNLGYEAVISRVNSFHQARRAALDPKSSPTRRIAAQRRQLEILEWLWDTAAEPVLSALGYHQPPPVGTALPRLWWAPGGLLGLLPIHAAGRHADAGTDKGSGSAVMDRVVSSYTPTIRSLRYARQHARRAGSSTGRALIVAMPVTPGLPGGELPNVPREVARVRALLPEIVLLAEHGPTGEPLNGSIAIPTRQNVLDHLAGHPVVHFACHGYSDPRDPSKSHLLLHDHDRHPLTVASLSLIDLGQAQLAYLSACETAFTGAVKLIDEAIHLTTAFQLAGFPHVIGTLWEIDDSAAVKVASDFYSGLRTASLPGLDTSRAAVALNNAIRAARHAHPRTPSLWAAYLHAGA